MGNYLHYGKISLRPLEPEDLDLLYEWENTISVWEVSNTKAPFSRHLLARYIQESTTDIYASKQLRLIIQTPDNKPVGMIDLFDFDPYHQRAGIGILIHETENRRKGYASDAIRAIFQYGLHVIGLYQLYANVAEENTISLKLFENLGFKVSGIKKEWLQTPQGRKNVVFMQKILVS
jgi:diamine N-acetyltransferase